MALNSVTKAVERECKEAARSFDYQTLKDHQILVLSSFVKGNDVFGYAHARVDNDIHSISQLLLEHYYVIIHSTGTSQTPLRLREGCGYARLPTVSVRRP